MFYQGKVATARFYMARVLPETNALFANIAAGAKSLMELPAEAF
ncbi:MAG TPA: acyl-CoA dehydrogenase C-terminal domain-containing protein [Stellaceae bacterium]|nr:acyl-CoA dehydrogenase C-terminal domain-containing protein [Stellaceae bacterium]